MDSDSEAAAPRRGKKRGRPAKQRTMPRESQRDVAPDRPPGGRILALSESQRFLSRTGMSDLLPFMQRLQNTALTTEMVDLVPDPNGPSSSKGIAPFVKRAFDPDVPRRILPGCAEAAMLGFSKNSVSGARRKFTALGATSYFLCRTAWEAVRSWAMSLVDEGILEPLVDLHLAASDGTSLRVALRVLRKVTGLPALSDATGSVVVRGHLEHEAASQTASMKIMQTEIRSAMAFRWVVTGKYVAFTNEMPARLILTDRLSGMNYYRCMDALQQELHNDIEFPV